VVVMALVHPLVQLVNLFLQKLFLHWFQVAESRVVTSEQLVEFVHVSHIVLFLEGDVDDSLRNLFANSVKELCLSNNDFKQGVKLDRINHIITDFLSVKDVLLKQVDGFFGVLLPPVVKDNLLVALIKFFS